MKIFLAFFQPDDDDKDFKQTRRTTESSDRSTGGGSSIVTTTGDRSRKQRADEDRSRGDLVKIPREKLSGVRRGDSEPRDDQAPKNRPDSAPFDNVTYRIPSSLHHDRGNRYSQDAQDLRMGIHPHEDSRGRHGSQLGIAEVEGCATFTTETGTDTEMTDCDVKEGMIGRGVWGGSLVVVTMMVCFFD